MTIIGALAPIFIIILAGHLLRRTSFLPDAFWPPAEKLTYYFFFPALMIVSLAEAPLDGLPVGRIALAAALPPLIGCLVLVATRRLWFATKDGPAFTSFLQGAIRPNTYVGLAAAAALFPAQGLAITALCIAVVVPLVNFLSVVVLLRYAAPGQGLGRMVKSIVTNPLIIGCLIGALLNFSGIGLPPIVKPSLKILANASLAIGLLAIGAGLDFASFKRAAAPTLASSFLKLGAMPALAWGFGLLLGLDLFPLTVTILYAALPTAPNSYILARQLGGDAPLAGSVITVTTILAAATLSIVMLMTNYI